MSILCLVLYRSNDKIFFYIRIKHRMSDIADIFLNNGAHLKAKYPYKNEKHLPLCFYCTSRKQRVWQLRVEEGTNRGGRGAALRIMFNFVNAGVTLAVYSAGTLENEWEVTTVDNFNIQFSAPTYNYKGKRIDPCLILKIATTIFAFQS